MNEYRRLVDLLFFGDHSYQDPEMVLDSHLVVETR